MTEKSKSAQTILSDSPTYVQACTASVRTSTIFAPLCTVFAPRCTMYARRSLQTAPSQVRQEVRPRSVPAPYFIRKRAPAPTQFPTARRHTA
jgi:hypothetical protein